MGFGQDFIEQHGVRASVCQRPMTRCRLKRRLGTYTGQARAERQAADELERERVAEFERELAFEMNGDLRPGQEDEETRADIEPARALRAGSLRLDWRDADRFVRRRQPCLRRRRLNWLLSLGLPLARGRMHLCRWSRICTRPGLRQRVSWTRSLNGSTRQSCAVECLGEVGDRLVIALARSLAGWAVF